MDKIHYTTEAQAAQVRSYTLTKRMVDVCVSLVLLLLLMPFLLLFSLLIVVFSGRPIFFKQERTGKHNKPFIIWKFRTIEETTDHQEFHSYDWKDGVPNDFIFKTPSGLRITKIGRIYRKLSIDELPQLINVLRGDMSLVGPRPEIPKITQLYNHYQSRRLKVKPGITGYAQVNGRSINNHGKKIEYDRYYVANHSFLLDMKIIVKTIGLVMRGKGAW